MAMALRLLSGIETGRVHRRHATTLEEARAAFEAAWRVFLSNRTDADFKAWRDQRDCTAREYAVWKR